MKKLLRVSIIFFKIFIAAVIFTSFAKLLNSYTNVEGYIWQLIIFCFSVGTFIFSMRAEHLKDRNKKNLSKTGFLMIFSSISILVSYGFGFITPNGILSLTVIRNTSGIIFFMAIFLLSFGLVDLTTELGKNFFYKNKV